MSIANVPITKFVDQRLDIIESEIHELRYFIKKNLQASREEKKPRVLRGILSGLKVQERDIEQAKRSLFKNINSSKLLNAKLITKDTKIHSSAHIQLVW